MNTQAPGEPPNAGNDNNASEAKKALEREENLPLNGWHQEVELSKQFGRE